MDDTILNLVQQLHDTRANLISLNEKHPHSSFSAVDLGVIDDQIDKLENLYGDNDNTAIIESVKKVLEETTQAVENYTKLSREVEQTEDAVEAFAEGDVLGKEKYEELINKLERVNYDDENAVEALIADMDEYLAAMAQEKEQQTREEDIDEVIFSNNFANALRMFFENGEDSGVIPLILESGHGERFDLIDNLMRENPVIGSKLRNIIGGLI